MVRLFRRQTDDNTKFERVTGLENEVYILYEKVTIFAVSEQQQVRPDPHPQEKIVFVSVKEQSPEKVEQQGPSQDPEVRKFF